MKTIEEKAKRYDDLLVKLQEAKVDNDVCDERYCCVIDNIVPELKESEDERIRKAIIEHFEGSHSSMYPYKGFTKEQILAWLEKQGEQKTEVKYVYTKFQIGDTIVEIKPNGYCQPVRVKYIGHGAYSCESDDGKRFLSFPVINQDDYELVEQKPAEFDDANAKRMFIKALERVEEQNNKGYKLTDCDKNSWWEDFKAYTTSKQILANSAKTCKDEQKPAWSEEDDLMLKSFVNLVEMYYGNCINKTEKNKMLDWLKSLRPQNRWKPNDEQMDALHYVTNFDYGGHKSTLVSLYEQLKKLK